MNGKFRQAALPMLALLAGAFALPMSPVRAVSQDPFVPVSQEPSHHVRFDNGIVRIYDVQRSKGQWTLFHEHTADNFAVFINTTRQVYEFRDGRHGTKQLTAGEVTFASTAEGPYVHRVGGDGKLPFHAVDIELLAKGRLGTAADMPRRAGSPFKLVLENARGRAYGMVLEAGKTTEAFIRPANTAIFAVSAGRISERAEGREPRLWDTQPGDFRWVEATERLAISNEGTSQVELVEIEMF